MLKGCAIAALLAAPRSGRPPAPGESGVPPGPLSPGLKGFAVAKPINTIPPSVHRATNAHEGWREIFSPASGAMAYLTYARLVLTPKVRTHSIARGDREWAVFGIAGSAAVKVDGRELTVGVHDLLYVPRNARIDISGESGTDLAFGGATADRDAEPKLICNADIQGDPGRCIDVGRAESNTKRRIHSMLDTSVPCSRLLAGFTVGSPGGWTSWPPHEHNDSKEEFYLFFDMPAPAFSVQYVYSGLEKMELAAAVRDGDCVAIPSGYHPTVAIPGFSTVFMWVMAAYDPDKHRDLKYGITIQPEFKDIKFL